MITLFSLAERTATAFGPTTGEPTATNTTPPATPDGELAHAALAGGGATLWSGSLLTFPADANGSAGDGTQVYRGVAATLEAERPVCDNGTVEITVSVRVENLGPGAGQAYSGKLELFNGTAAVIEDRLDSSGTYAPGFTDTLTVTATVPAWDFASGDILIGLWLETFHVNGKAWEADQFEASYEFGTTGCEPAPVMDCETDSSLFNTGYNGSGGQTPAGQRDLNWDVGLGTDGGDPSTVENWIDAWVVAGPGSWYDPFTDANWISYWGNTSHSGLGIVDVFFRYYFDLDSAVALDSFALTIDYYADNSVWAIYINGTQVTATGVPQSPGNPYFHMGFVNGAQAQTFLDEGWQHGLNELVVQVRSGEPAQGFLARVTSESLCPVQQPAFECTTTAFLSQGGSAASDPADMYEVNVVTGASTLAAPDFFPTNINAIGYNPLDNYVYGWINTQYTGAPAAGIARIGSDYSVENLGPPTNAASFPVFDNNYHIGDFDDAGQYWISDTQRWAQIDLDASSPTYMQIIAASTMTLPVAGYTFADWGFNPDDGNFYTIAHTTANANKRLWRFDPSTAVVTNVADLGNITGTFGAIYTDAAGNLFGSNNATGEIWHVFIPTASASFLAQGPISGLNDGAICFLEEQVLEPGLEVIKIADQNAQIAIIQGQTITYTITVRNNGPVPIYDIVVTDTLDPSVVCESLTNTISQLDPGDSEDCQATYIVTAQDFANGSITNTATAVGSCEDNADDECITTEGEETVPELDPQPDLEMEKTANHQAQFEINEGDLITYTFTVENTGNVTLSNVTITDEMGGLSSIICLETGHPIPQLAPGQVETCTATYLVTQQDIDNGSIVNTATVEGCFPAGPDICAEDEAEEEVPAPDPDPQLLILKTADQEAQAEIEDGQIITYTFQVFNTGNVTLTNIVVSDELDGLSDIDCGGDGDNVIASLEPGDEVVCAATYEVTLDDINSGGVVNTATVSGCFETICIEDEDGEEVPSDPDPELDIDKVADEAAQQAISLGQVITYTFTVTNIGNVTLNDILVSDELPGLSAIVCEGGANPIESLNPGETEECAATYTVTQADIDNQTVVNRARVEGCFTEDDCTEDEEEVTVPGPPANPEMDVDKVADAEALLGIAPGQVITFTIRVTNTGNVTLTNILVTDPTVSGLTCPGGNPIPSLAPGEFVDCTATYTVTQEDINNGGVENTATAEGCYEETCVDDEGEEFVEGPVRGPRLRIDKRADSRAEDRIRPGQTVTYTFIVRNTGNVTLTNVLVTDELDGLSEIECEGGSNPIPVLQPGESETCTATYVVTQEDIESGGVRNTASVEGCFNQECVSDEDGVRLEVPSDPGQNVTVTPTPTVTLTPTPTATPTATPTMTATPLQQSAPSSIVPPSTGDGGVAR